MASGTRSRHTQKDAGTDSSRCKSVGAEVKDTKVTDISNLRTTPREAPAKNTTRKSERLEKQHAPVSSSNTTMESIEKRRPPSPLRRSQRIEKNSSSSGSKTSSRSSSSLDMKKKKKDIESRKMSSTFSEEQGVDNKPDTNFGRLQRKKKFMAARSYRALLRSETKLARLSEAHIMLQKDDGQSEIDTADLGVSVSNKILESEDKRASSKDGESTQGFSGEDVKEEEASNSSSQQGSRHRESAHYGMKRSYVEGWPDSKSSDDLLQSSRVDVFANGKHGRGVNSDAYLEVDETETSCYSRDDVETPELAESAYGRSLAVDTQRESEGKARGSKRVKISTDMSSDLSVAPSKSESLVYDALPSGAVSPPVMTKFDDGQGCATCSKPQRICNGSQHQELCSCNGVKGHSFPIPCSEVRWPLLEVCELHPWMANGSRVNDAVVQCSQLGETKEALSPEAMEEVYGTERETANCLIASSSVIYVTLPLEEDRGNLEAAGGIRVAEELASPPNVKESCLAVEGESGPNACVVCKLPGLLLCCEGKGCKRSYHLSCLDPPLLEVPPCGWLCLSCLKKKMEFGVYSISEGVESVWNVKDGMQNEKHYFVKYKGLAHVHNLWIPESQLQQEASMLVAKVNRRNQKEKVLKWKEEWAEPQRLLLKRLLIPEKLVDKHLSGDSNDSSSCCYEWLVKWKGLGYEHATWEFENLPCLCSSEAMMLMEDYERRHEGARKTSDNSTDDKVLHAKQSPLQKLSRLPDSCPSGLDNDHLTSVNRIWEFWHKSQNAVFIDDQERIIKSVLFMLSIQPFACRPFLIISPTTCLSCWESELARLAPGMDVVVYNGGKDVRKMIQTLEFYDKSGCVMFQVLLSHSDAVVEDIEALSCIGWEAIIVDECQSSRVSRNFEQLRHVPSDFRLLLMSGPLKDNLAEHLNMLSFLDSGENENSGHNLKLESSASAGALAIAKERLARHLAYERKSDSSKFSEYWVPVQLSNVQLEQYCAALISNAIALRSCLKVDQVGALRDILISTRKCCDHPYLVDELLPSSLTKDRPITEYLDVGVKASGKLQLLDKILHEILHRGLRVLILFQSIGGAGRNSIGDILDDFLRQRFGQDSYERVDGGLVMSKKLAAVNKFNDKTKGRFAFLIENRACRPSIKLTSVDAVIIYDSDWNPMNDLRALQKINIGSQCEPVKVFRLYTSCTVEEKVLICATQDTNLGSNMQNISPSVSNSLLSWGASNLFSRLDELHRQENLNIESETSTDNLFLDDVVLEVLNQLPTNDDTSDSGYGSILIKALQSGASYSRNNIIGVKEYNCLLDGDPPRFWSNLLDGRYPQWRYISGPLQRSRRKAQYFDKLSTAPLVEGDELKKKRRKVLIDIVDPVSLQDKRKETAGFVCPMVREKSLHSRGFDELARISPGRMSNAQNIRRAAEAPRSQADSESQFSPWSSVFPDGNLNKLHDTSSNISEHRKSIAESETREKLDNAQRNLHLVLKPELLELSKILNLPEDIKLMAEMLLEYIMNNHVVSQESETILQAFKISLCWRAASFSKFKIDHTESLALAKKYLNFECNEEQVYSVYSKLRMLKRKFAKKVNLSKNDTGSSSWENYLSVQRKDVAGSLIHEGASGSAASVQQEVKECRIMDNPHVHSCAQPDSVDHGLPSLPETPVKHQQHIGSLKDELLKKQIDLIEKICSMREEKLVVKQQQEYMEIDEYREQQKMKLEKLHDLESDLICELQIDCVLANEQIRLMNETFLKNMVKLDQYIDCQRKVLAVMQAGARDKERQIKDNWLNDAKTGRLKKYFDSLPLSVSGFVLQEFKFKQDGSTGLSGDKIVSGTSPDPQCLTLGTMASLGIVESSEKISEVSSANCGRIEEITVEPQASVSHIKSIDPNEVSAQKESSSGTLVVVSRVGAGDMSVECETLAPEPRFLNSVGNVLNCVCTDPRSTTTVSIEQHGVAQGADAACLNSRRQDGKVVRSLGNLSSSSCSENSASSDQVPSPTECGRPATSSGVRNDQGISSQHTMVPALRSSDVTFSDPNQLESPSCTGMAAVLQVTTSAPIVCVDEACDRIQCYTQPNFVSPIEPCDQSQSLIPETVVSVQPIVPGDQTRSCIPQTDVSAQSPIEPCDQAECSMQQTVLLAQSAVEPCDQAQCSQSPLEPGDQVQSFIPQTVVSETQTEPCDQTQCSQSPIEPCDEIQSLIPQSVVSVQQTEPCDRTQCSSEQILVSAQSPIEPCDQAQCSGEQTVLSAQPVIDPCDQTHSLMQETVVSTEPTVVSREAQYTQYTELASRSLEPLMPSDDNVPGRTQFEDPRSSGVQAESESSLPQISPISPLMLPQALHPDPLVNELTRLRKQEDSIMKIHEDKKIRLKLECQEELDKVRKKYDVLAHDAETDFVREKKALEAIYTKVLMNQVLAEEFRVRFVDNKGGTSAAFQGLRPSSAQYSHQASQSHHALSFPPLSIVSAMQYSHSASQSHHAPSMPPVSLASAFNQPSTATSLHPARLQAPAPASSLTSVPSSQFPNNAMRPHITSWGNLQAGVETRVPAPHLQRFRSQLPVSTIQTGVLASQQQPLANLTAASTAAPQVSPVIPVARTSRAPISGAYQIETLGIMPICPATTISNVDLPRNSGSSHNVAGLQNLSRSTEMVREFDLWLASSRPQVGNRPISATTDIARTAATNAADVLCISDDDS